VRSGGSANNTDATKRARATVLAVTQAIDEVFEMAPAETRTAAATLEYPELSSDDPVRRVIETRAVEAVIWGMPAVNSDLMLQEMLTKTKGKVNQIVYWSRPLDWKNQTLTPNPDSIYFMTFVNTKDAGPIVLEIPPADAGGSFAGNIVTLWQAALEDVGPEGLDKGSGGKFLILPPDYKGTPPAGYYALQSDTYTSYALLRSNLVSHSDADVEKSVAYGKQTRIYPLSQTAQPPETVFTDASDVLFDSTIPYDGRFFKSLDRVVQNEPWIQRDRAMIDQLRSIGIEKGMPFHPDKSTKEILDTAALEAKAWLDERYGEGFPPFWPGSRWALPAWPEVVQGQSTNYANEDSYPVDLRGLAYSYGYIGIKRLGKAQYYLMAIKDRNGEAFDGSRTYRLRVPANPPTKQYWSATAYDRATHALIRGMLRASRSSQISELQKNADGSVDVYFGPGAPSGRESNWVPTSASGTFEVMFRLYGPEKPFFEKRWVLPDIEKLSVR
jgi:hypothetical protein